MFTVWMIIRIGQWRSSANRTQQIRSNRHNIRIETHLPPSQDPYRVGLRQPDLRLTRTVLHRSRQPEFDGFTRPIRGSVSSLLSRLFDHVKGGAGLDQKAVAVKVFSLARLLFVKKWNCA